VTIFGDNIFWLNEKTNTPIINSYIKKFLVESGVKEEFLAVRQEIITNKWL